MGERNGFQDTRFGNEVGHAFQRHMDGDKDDPQLVIGQHHGEIGSAGAIGQNFGVAGIGDACGLECFFMDGCCDHARNLAIDREINGGGDIIIRRFACACIDAAKRQISG